jgi:hypothetical protein
MSRTWYKDGLSRKKRLKDAEISEYFGIFNTDINALTAKAMSIADSLIFYDYQNRKSGYFSEVLNRNAFIALSQIIQFDVEEEEKLFLDICDKDYVGKETKERILISMILKFIQLFDMWLDFVTYSEINDAGLSLYDDIKNQITVNLNEPVSVIRGIIKSDYPDQQQPVLKSIWTYADSSAKSGSARKLFHIKRTFYSLLESVKFLKRRRERYIEEIATGGDLDPSISLFVAYAFNYKTVAEKFNNRWHEYPEFYLKNILKAEPNDIHPDSAYLMLDKLPNMHNVKVDKGTEFNAGKNELKQDIRYVSNDDIIINNANLEEVYSLYIEHDNEIDPAGELNYATSIKQSDFSRYISLEPSAEVKSVPGILFDTKGRNQNGRSNSSVGMIIQSPSLLLREGIRNVTLKFFINQNIENEIMELVKGVTKQSDINMQEAIYKVLNDVFYIDITTEEGWQRVQHYTFDFESVNYDNYLVLHFTLNSDFPETAGYSALHGNNSNDNTPALRLVISDDAWLFPYTWLKRINIQKIDIETEVSGVSHIQVYSELGQLDTSIPFFPFGVVPKRGAWFAIGNYEMSQKNIKQVDVKLQWLYVPTDNYGMYDYYKLYDSEIDNSSFKVTTQVLTNRKWIQTSKENIYNLFNTNVTNDVLTQPKAPLNSATELKNISLKNSKIKVLTEDKYTYNMFARSGFFRITLAEPGMAFGHLEYQSLLTDFLINKVRSKKLLPEPNLPFSPQLDKIEISYRSKDTINLSQKPFSDNIKVYHLFPLNKQLVYPVTLGKQLSFVPDIGDQGNLLFGLSGLQRGEVIRMFIDFTPHEKEIDKDQFPLIRWYIGDGYNWKKLREDNIIQDTTRNFLESGVVEIRIPDNLPDVNRSAKGVIWLRAGVKKNVNSVSAVKGFYINVIKVTLDTAQGIDNNILNNGLEAGTIVKSRAKLPGIANVTQIIKSSGGRIKESYGDMRIRLSERISHRQRAVNSVDFERLVLQQFPEVEKVKCLPGLDSKGNNRQGVVTLAVMKKQSETSQLKYSKANSKLLIDIERYLSDYTSPFVIVDAINPVYEEIQVRCKIRFMGDDYNENYLIMELNKLLNSYMAFWLESGDMPVFGNTISLTDLANLIRGEEYVENISNFSVLHIVESGEKIYELNELEEFTPDEVPIDSNEKRIRVFLNEEHDEDKNIQQIRSSKPWAILVPADRHSIVPDYEDQNDKAGIDDLELGNTFVIG